MIDELDWVKNVRPCVERPSREARLAARQALEREITKDIARAGHRRGRRVRGPKLGWLATAAATAVTLAVAAGALLLLGGHKRPVASTAAAPGGQQLVDILAVLRRPQTKADLNPQLLSRLNGRARLGPLGTPDLPLIRLATVTPWGERVFLVPMKPPTASAVRAAVRRSPGLSRLLSRRADEETLGVFTITAGGGGGSCCATAASIEAGGGPGTESFRPLHGTGYTRLIDIVPDGVAEVSFVLPRQVLRPGPQALVYKHPLTVTARVHGNVAAVQVARQCCSGQIPTIWYRADDQVLKRVGNPAAANRVITLPKPGPQTVLSRAAERDPSTPNPVWVTPRTGGPHARFELHFRVLLTGAAYRYTFTGTRCPQLPYTNGGVGGGLHDIRGQLWSQSLSPGSGQALCPGTYHVSVAVVSIGIGIRRRPLRPPARPFGTATFTVTR